MCFDAPTQVHFLAYGKEWCYGIAYNDEIICACCGGTFPLDEVSNITTLEWVDLVDEMRDETLPYGETEE